MLVFGLVHFGSQQGGSAGARFDVQLLLGPRPLQTVDGSTVYDLMHGFREPVHFRHADVGNAALVGRRQIRAGRVIRTFAPRVLYHVGLGRSLREAAVGGVLLVLKTSLLVRACLLLLPPLLKAHYYSDSDQHHQRNKCRYRGYHHHVFGGEISL